MSKTHPHSIEEAMQDPEAVQMWPASLEDQPELCIAQCCTLHVEQDGYRVWVCRVSDGVTVEKYDPVAGRWNTVAGDCAALNLRSF